MDELKTEIPGEKELSIIRYLLNEIDEERAYNNAYREEYEKASTLAKEKILFIGALWIVKSSLMILGTQLLNPTLNWSAVCY